MPHTSDALFGGGNMAELAGNHESVLVTHVESPVFFYCRLVTDEEQFNALLDKIGQQVESEKPVVPNVNALENPSKYVLVYSIIRDRWCRGRVLSYQRNVDLKPINAKVCLIDYGSIEIVLWNEKYVRSSGPEIDAFNDGRGFCFPCALGNIQPFDDNGKPTGVHQWSSYANFLIEKETKNRPFMLCVHQQSKQHARNIVICDLIPASDVCARENHTFFSQTPFTSLSSYLVASNVARYIDRQTDQNSPTQSDDEKENVFFAHHS